MRIRARIPVKIRHRPDNPRLALKGVTQNISAGGIHIIHTEPLSVESRVRVALASREERDEHSCGGRVTRCRPMSKHRFEIGIAFLHTHAAFQQHVDCLMREYGRGNSA
jgi:c-di-GMP-binding flagellar brake protein YcgR